MSCTSYALPKLMMYRPERQVPVLAQFNRLSLACVRPTPLPQATRDAPSMEHLLRSQEAITQDHVLLSYQEILDAYGQPDKVEYLKDGSVLWAYQFEPDNERPALKFKFGDGLVVDVLFR